MLEFHGFTANSIRTIPTQFSRGDFRRRPELDLAHNVNQVRTFSFVDSMVQRQEDTLPAERYFLREPRWSTSYCSMNKQPKHTFFHERGELLNFTAAKRGEAGERPALSDGNLQKKVTCLPPACTKDDNSNLSLIHI